MQNKAKSPQLLFQRELSKVNFGGLSSLQSVLLDRVTTQTFMKAIKNNQSQFANKIVLHISTQCNPFYSIFAAQAGAKKVHCVVNGYSEGDRKNVFMMKQIIKENGLDNVISVQLIGEFHIDGKVDVLLGEPMGYNLYFDGNLQTLIDARDRYLDENKGIILPNKLSYKSALICDQYQKDDKVNFWDQVYGVTMANMKQWVTHQPIIRGVDPAIVVSSVAIIKNFDLYEVSYQQLEEIKKTVAFKPLAKEEVRANGFCIWFESVFSLADGEQLVIDSSPWNEQTRWTQSTLYTNKQWIFSKGESKKITFIAKKNQMNGQTIFKLKTDDKEEIYKVV